MMQIRDRKPLWLFEYALNYFHFFDGDADFFRFGQRESCWMACDEVKKISAQWPARRSSLGNMRVSNGNVGCNFHISLDGVRVGTHDMAALGQIFGGGLCHARKIYIHHHFQAEALTIIAGTNANIRVYGSCDWHVYFGFTRGKAHGTEVTPGIACGEKLFRIGAFARAAHFRWGGESYSDATIICFAEAFTSATVGCGVCGICYLHGGAPVVAFQVLTAWRLIATRAAPPI
jgi:hypothetical protein